MEFSCVLLSAFGILYSACLNTFCCGMGWLLRQPQEQKKLRPQQRASSGPNQRLGLRTFFLMTRGANGFLAIGGVDKRLHAMIRSLDASLDHPRRPRFSHQGRVEKYPGGNEVTKLTARGAELLFNLEFELEHGHPDSIVKKLFDTQRRATGDAAFIDKRCRGCDGLTLEAFLTRYTYHDERVNDKEKQYNLIDLSYDTVVTKRLHLERPASISLEEAGLPRNILEVFCVQVTFQ